MRTKLVLVALLIGMGLVSAESLPPLPAWSPSDFEKLGRGEIIPGEGLFGRPDEEVEDDPPVAEVEPPAVEEVLPVEQPVEEPPTELTPELVSAYLAAAPVDEEGEPHYLVDPQELLAQQDSRDRESFLRYHAVESTIDVHVYLLDARQELPPELTLDAIYEAHYAEGPPCVLVFYHLGVPDRAQLLMSRDVLAVTSEDEQKRALRAAVQEAFEKSDPAYQLDNFLVELSIRLYWIERAMTGGKVAGTEMVSASGPRVLVPGPASGRDEAWEVIRRMIILGSLVTGLALVGLIGKVIADRRIRHVFPEVESGPLLGAPHAAGVGAVVSFSNAHLPPSQQRDEVPDYLQRL